MSRSRKKVAKAQVCWGNNTPYYKAARKHLRVKNKQEMQRLGKDLEVVDEKVMGFQNKHDNDYDEWNEPTDGTYVATKGEFFTEEDIKKLKRK